MVRDEKVAHIENLYQYKNVKQFEYDIEILKKYYKPLNPKDLVNSKVSNNQFLITFDDGLIEIYNVIFPILKKNNLKAIFFINPNFVDNNEALYKHFISVAINNLKEINFDKNITDEIAAILSFSYPTNQEFIKNFINIEYSERRKTNQILKLLKFDKNKFLKENPFYVSTEMIQEMIDDGQCFGGHTMSHPRLEKLTFDAQKEEIINSINWLKNNFNIDYSLFAFPFSDKKASRKLLIELFEFDSNIKIFGNSGLKKDIDKRIIQRFSLENPFKKIEKQIVTENLYKYFNKVIGKYKINRK